ncbi:MAG: hypothetical protein AAF721_26965 [Myxococcota bacterium]
MADSNDALLPPRRLTTTLPPASTAAVTRWWRRLPDVQRRALAPLFDEEESEEVGLTVLVEARFVASDELEARVRREEDALAWETLREWVVAHQELPVRVDVANLVLYT